jgi:hypothetical protein
MTPEVVGGEFGPTYLNGAGEAQGRVLHDPASRHWKPPAAHFLIVNIDAFFFPFAKLLRTF